MKNKENKESIKAFNSYLVKGIDSSWSGELAFLKTNKQWLKNSAKVAIKLNRALRDQGLSQNDLADRLNVTKQQVSKWLKGKENLTFQTVSKLELVLGIKLMTIISPEEIQAMIEKEVLEARRTWTKTLDYLKRDLAIKAPEASYSSSKLSESVPYEYEEVESNPSVEYLCVAA